MCFHILIYDRVASNVVAKLHVTNYTADRSVVFMHMSNELPAK